MANVDRSEQRYWSDVWIVEVSVGLFHIGNFRELKGRWNPVAIFHIHIGG